MSVRPKVLRLAGVVHDAIIAAASFYLAYVIIFGWTGAQFVPGVMEKVAAFTAISVGMFYFFSLNSGSWRYASIPDLLAIVKSAASSILVYTLALFIINRADNLPRSAPILLFVFLVTGLSTPRLLVRLYRESGGASWLFGARSAQQPSRHVLLYGLNDNAESFIRNARRQDGPSIEVVGIIDRDASNTARQVQGRKVLGDITNLERIVADSAAKDRPIRELIICDQHLTPSELGFLVERASQTGLAISRLPDMSSRREISENHVIDTNPIHLSDLLGRPEVKIDTVEVARLIDGKCILLTGAGGSIGSELARQIASFNPRHLVLADNSEYLLYKVDIELREKFRDLQVSAFVADVRDRERIMTLFKALKPEVVFHAAALKHVPLVEDNPIEAIKTNVLGTQNVADAAARFHSRAFVMISTDKAVNPTNIMGATKRAAEAYCQGLDLRSEHTRFKTVRFGNVIGSNGSVVPRFQEQISRGGPVTVTHPEIIRFFMSIPEAVRLVLQASGHGLRAQAERGKILVLDMGKPVRIADLAQRMIQLAGLRPNVDIEIVYTGLRPGEKLYEELFDDNEIAVSVPEHGYSIATPRTTNEKILERLINDLRTTTEAQDSEAAVKLLRHIVPEYSAPELVAPQQPGAQGRLIEHRQ